MNPDDFKTQSTGRVVSHPTGYFAFVPAPPPIDVAVDRALGLALSRADAALGELSGLGCQLPNPHLLIAPLVRREAVLSSRIEGTRASISDVLLDEAGTPDPSQSAIPDVQDVRNYVVALEYGIARLRDLPLSTRLVREIHEKLMQGVRGKHATPGEFRRTQNWIGPAGSTPTTAPYVPPPVEELPEVLGAWEKYLHVRDTLPDLVQCAIMHEHFEAIHPFLDGNGRVGRLLITLFLIERGRLSQPLLYLSDFIERHRSDYYDLLQRIRTHGDYAAWLRYFLAGVEETARDAIARARKLLALREEYLHAIKSPNATGLADALLSNPYVTIASAARALGVTQPTATKVIRQLVASGHLRQITRGNWGKTYLAPAILEAVDLSK